MQKRESYLYVGMDLHKKTHKTRGRFIRLNELKDQTYEPSPCIPPVFQIAKTKYVTMYRGYNDTSYTLDAYTRVAGHEIGHVLGIDDAYEDLPIQ